MWDTLLHFSFYSNGNLADMMLQGKLLWSSLNTTFVLGSITNTIAFPTVEKWPLEEPWLFPVGDYKSRASESM